MAFPSDFRIIYGNYFRKGDNRDGPYFVDENGVGTPMNGGGGGGGGGDASAANQVTGNASLASIDGKVATQTTVAAILARNNLLGTEVTLAAMSAKLPASLGIKTAAASLSVSPASDALFAANTLAAAGVARQLAAAASGGASANTALTTTCRRISITARLSDIRYAIGSSSQTASATTHFIAMGERLDLAVPATPNIAVLSATTTAGVLEVTELT